MKIYKVIFLGGLLACNLDVRASQTQLVQWDHPVDRVVNVVLATGLTGLAHDYLVPASQPIDKAMKAAVVLSVAGSQFFPSNTKGAALCSEFAAVGLISHWLYRQICPAVPNNHQDML